MYYETDDAYWWVCTNFQLTVQVFPKMVNNQSSVYLRTTVYETMVKYILILEYLRKNEYNVKLYIKE